MLKKETFILNCNDILQYHCFNCISHQMVYDKQNTNSACSSSAFSEQIVFKLKTLSLLSDAFITQNRRINQLLTQIVHDSNLQVLTSTC